MRKTPSCDPNLRYAGLHTVLPQLRLRPERITVYTTYFREVGPTDVSVGSNRVPQSGRTGTRPASALPSALSRTTIRVRESPTDGERCLYHPSGGRWRAISHSTRTVEWDGPCLFREARSRAAGPYHCIALRCSICVYVVSYRIMSERGSNRTNQAERKTKTQKQNQRPLRYVTPPHPNPRSPRPRPTLARLTRSLARLTPSQRQPSPSQRSSPDQRTSVRSARGIAPPSPVVRRVRASSQRCSVGP